MAVSAQGSKHEIGALLRAHLSAATQYGRHLTQHCAICHRLLRLAWENGPPGDQGSPTIAFSTHGGGPASP